MIANSSTGVVCWPIGQEGPQPEKLTIRGLDNYKKPRQEFANWIAAMDDEGFVRKAEERIWLSAYANNNPRSDYHWQADACYDEAQRRGNPDLYSRAHARACAT